MLYCITTVLGVVFSTSFLNASLCLWSLEMMLLDSFDEASLFLRANKLSSIDVGLFCNSSVRAMATGTVAKN